MSDYIKVNVNKAGGVQAGKGLLIKQHISLIDVNDIVSLPERDGSGVVAAGTIVMKPNTYAITLYLTQDSAELSSNSEGDSDNEGFTPSLKFKHPGNKQAVREFKANWVDRKCIVIISNCDTGSKDMIGDLCNPCKMQVSLSANKDATNNEFTFAQLMRGNDIAIFEGIVPLAEPLAIVPSGNNYLGLSLGSGEYQLTGGAIDIEADPYTPPDGMVFTVLGVKSGVAPVINNSLFGTASYNAYLFKQGNSWTGGIGKQITFKTIRHSGENAIFMEISRID